MFEAIKWSLPLLLAALLLFEFLFDLLPVVLLEPPLHFGLGQPGLTEVLLPVILIGVLLLLILAALAGLARLDYQNTLPLRIR